MGRSGNMALVAFAAVLLLSVTVLGGAAPSTAAFPGGNGEIVFYRFWDDLWVVNPDGTNLRWLIEGSSAAWSPDGDRIVYVSSGVWIMNHDGSDRHLVTDLGPGLGAAHAAWAPDGEHLVIEATSIPSLVADLYVVAIDGSGLTRITDYDGSESDPVWSPDGDRIAFEWNGDLWTVAPDGSDLTPIVDLPYSVHYPDWSPDGERIVFNEYNGRNFTWRIWVVDDDGSNLVPITEDRWNYTAVEPAWSPDGTKLVYRNTDDELAIMNPDGSEQQSLGLEGNRPDWRPTFHAPVVVDDGPFPVTAGATVTGNVLSNDRDPDGSALTAVEVAGPLHGTLTLDPDGAFAYTADRGYMGPDSFAYKAHDGYLYSEVATAHLDVQPVPRGVGLVDPTTGIWRLRAGDLGEVSFYYGNPGDYPFMGDWDGDGIDTPGLFRQSDAYAYLRNSNTQGIADIRFFFGNPADIPLAGDFNGDGCDTVSIYRPSEQRFYIINQLGANEGGLGAADYWFLFGNPGDKPVVGDWDGDGIDEVGLHREATGFFYWRNTLSTGIADGQIYFGDPGDRFVAGDWGTIDTKDTPAVYRPSNQVFYFRHTLTQGIADTQFTWTGAATTWLPIAGTYSYG